MMTETHYSPNRKKEVTIVDTFRGGYRVVDLTFTQRTRNWTRTTESRVKTLTRARKLASEWLAK